MTDEVVILFRPTGPKELALVKASGFRRWPPRLAGQPIFYPVTTRDYAIAIARDWNVKESGCGYGGKKFTEWWIPAEDLESLNDNLVGLIEVLDEFPGTVP